jgi:hypothetical protein
MAQKSQVLLVLGCIAATIPSAVLRRWFSQRPREAAAVRMTLIGLMSLSCFPTTFDQFYMSLVADVCRNSTDIESAGRFAQTWWLSTLCACFFGAIGVGLVACGIMGERKPGTYTTTTWWSDGTTSSSDEEVEDGDFADTWICKLGGLAFIVVAVVCSIGAMLTAPAGIVLPLWGMASTSDLPALHTEHALLVLAPLCTLAASVPVAIFHFCPEAGSALQDYALLVATHASTTDNGTVNDDSELERLYESDVEQILGY